MAHDQQRNYCLKVRERYPAHFCDCRVLEIGSLNLNGTVRDLFHVCRYMGVDVAPGPGVDVVAPEGMAHYFATYKPLTQFDTIISAECLEHDREWRETLRVAASLLVSGGLMCLTCATTGRAEHGTTRSKPWDAPGLPWPTYYANVTEEMVREAIDVDAIFSEYEFAIGHETNDLYFSGIKR